MNHTHAKVSEQLDQQRSSKQKKTLLKLSRRAFQRLSRRQRARFRRVLDKRARLSALALVSASLLVSPTVARAQLGAMPSAPSQGVVNQAASMAVTRIRSIGASTPGFLYYGVNGADRGLGYIGSYMTLGGFIPYAQDDLGGFWSADLRGHLSVNGGFFSNVGLVRKQLTAGGSLLGVGVYWDYDGDLNQYAGQGGELYGQFGHVYQQVGVSGEFLTDWGNIRSNGYMPVGTTAYTVGAPGKQYTQNYVLCQYGLDAALGGADLEVGAYIPALADWAGMISVGGYALGNTFNKWQIGSRDGQAIVPWFGGVYTRLDVTFANNWDFSLQYNNDSFFESTGFARLTYRIGGSRRRNVPDQLEQPMMRNEHIVRAHQTPEIAGNQSTGLAWNVIHVDNSAAAGGNGTAESPFNTLAEANAAAVNPYDIVFVAAGSGVYAQSQTFRPLAANQFLIGDGAAYCIDTTCGPVDLALGGVRPTISNTAGASVSVDGGLTTANFIVSGSRIGVLADSNLATGSTATVLNYEILAGTSGQQTGIQMENTSGTLNVANTLVSNMNDTGIRVTAGVADAPDLNFQGAVTNDATAGGGTAALIDIQGSLAGGGGTISIAANGTPTVYQAGDPSCLVQTSVVNEVTDVGGQGIVVTDSLADITIDNVTLTDSLNRAISVTGSSGVIAIGQNGPGEITNPAGGAILVQGGAADFSYNGLITNTSGNAVIVDGTTGGEVVVENPAGSSTEAGAGIIVRNAQGDVRISDFEVTDTSGPGVLVQNNKFAAAGASFENIVVSNTNTTSAGFTLSNNTGPVALGNIDITTVGGAGIQANTNQQIAMSGTNTISATNAPALIDTNGSGIHTLAFADLGSVASPTNGVFLSGISGTLDVSGGMTVDQAAGVSVLMQNSTLTANISTATVTAGAAGGIQLFNMNDGQVDPINIGTATIETTGGTAFAVTNTSLYGANGLVSIGSGSISATNGTAISATNANLAVTLSSVSTTNAVGSGISLIDSGATGVLPGLTISSTAINGVAGTGIFLQGNEPNLSGTGVFADFGTVLISGTGQAGVYAQNTNATFSGASIDGFVNGMSIFADAGEETTVLLRNSSIGGTTAPTTGISIASNGTGTVNATLLSNGLSGATASLSAATSGVGEVLLNANANTPTADFNIDNVAGTVGISQADVPGLSSANGGVTVNETGLGVTDFNQAVPTP